MILLLNDFEPSVNWRSAPQLIEYFVTPLIALVGSFSFFSPNETSFQFTCFWLSDGIAALADASDHSHIGRLGSSVGIASRMCP